MGLKRRGQFPRASAFKDARGKRRWRWRHKGREVQLGTDYGSADFIRRYEEAEKGVAPSRTAPGSIDALAIAFYQSPRFTKLGANTKTTYRGIIDRFRESKTDKGVRRGSLLVRDLRRSSVMKIMGSMSDHPGAANNLLRMLRMLMKLALQLEWRDTDPTLGVDKFPTGPGFYTWSEADIAKFYERHEIGTIPHTAMTLMLCTAAARADVVRLGWGNVREGRIQYRRQKMLTRDGVLVDIRIHPDLAAVLDHLPRDSFTFLETRYSKARSPKAFGGAMRKWCDAAGLPECTSHGLRKAMARRLGEAGCTPLQIAAITGHKSMVEVAHYAEAANRANMADDGFDKLARTKTAQVVGNISPKNGEH